MFKLATKQANGRIAIMNSQKALSLLYYTTVSTIAHRDANDFHLN